MTDQFMEMLKERDDDGSFIMDGLNYAGEAYDRLEAAQEEIDALRAALRQCADDLEAYVKAQYPAGSFKYPSLERKYINDMEPVRRARALLGGSNE